MEYKKEFKVFDFTDRQPTEISHKKILDMTNTKRPYCLSDFKLQFFIPKLS